MRTDLVDEAARLDATPEIHLCKDSIVFAERNERRR